MADFREPFVETKLSLNAIEVMRQAGAKSYPNEACGMLIDINGKSIAVVCENSAPEPYSRFRISSEEYLRCLGLGKIIGIWHTHTDEDAKPSEADRSACEGTGVPWYIIAVNKDGDSLVFSDPESIDPNGYQTPYIGRPYVYGIHDCYTLVCDYYKREYGIEMNRDYPRIDEWWKKGYDFFTENFERENFVTVSDEPQVGDVFLLQMGSTVASHVAIYLGDDIILHHCHGRLSRRDVYGGMWSKHTVRHLRHKSKC